MLKRRPDGFAAFTVIWLGQLFSAVGTRMTSFALGIWMWNGTGSAMDNALLLFASFGSTVLVSPLAGALIDRWNRRVTIVLSDVGSMVVTAGLLLCFELGAAKPWEIFLANALTGALLAFQGPAYAAMIAQMMDRGAWPRANAMISVVRFAPSIFAPTVAAALLTVTTIGPVLVIDVLSYVVAIGTVFLVAVPPTPKAAEAQASSLWQDSLFGLRYIRGRSALVGLEILMFMVGLLAAMGYAVLMPLLLVKSDESITGLAFTIGAVGGVLGAVLMGVLKPTNNKMRRLLLAMLAFSVVGRIVFGVADNLFLWGIAMVVIHGCIPVIDGYGNAIWQEKVAPEIQGRVFAARQFIEDMAVPIGLIGAAPLAQDVFLPGMEPGHALSRAFGWMVGTGPGSGMGLLCVLVGVVGIVVTAVAFAVPAVRDVEKLIPDFVPVDADESASAAESVPSGIDAAAAPHVG
ncbi:MFS transporter [Streptomyces sp. SP17BM10]|uniref:MFS transporter n=1 Tax=Streptomyces sp. SP17BM10 TaxID=3002530 RepID=UPI002E7605DB|nr:MFS transporter [Streptomyces sp. SP17BM10]MEE1784673.1 MFS transporter [Streptomyces sp. SP17BM10]